MPKWDAPLDEWIKFYSPENFKNVGVEREVPVHKFLCSLRDTRAALAGLLKANDDVQLVLCDGPEVPGFDPSALGKAQQRVTEAEKVARDVLAVTP